MIRTQTQLVIGACMTLCAAGAQAFTIDYLTLANANEQGYSSYTTSDSGVTVTATGTSTSDTDNTPDYFAYLDSGNAGLGVCKVLNSNLQCSPSSDDNVTFGEALTLSFSQSVDLTSLSFRNESHGTTFASNAQLKVSVDGGLFQDFDLVHAFSDDLTAGSTFTFFSNDDQFYLSTVGGELNTPSTEAPVPGSLWLLGGSLIALRKRLLQRSTEEAEES